MSGAFASQTCYYTGAGRDSEGLITGAEEDEADMLLITESIIEMATSNGTSNHSRTGRTL